MQGKAHAFYTVVSSMQQQADAFGLSFRHLTFDGFNAERDLLCRLLLEAEATARWGGSGACGSLLLARPQPVQHKIHP